MVIMGYLFSKPSFPGFCPRDPSTQSWKIYSMNNLVTTFVFLLVVWLCVSLQRECISLLIDWGHIPVTTESIMGTAYDKLVRIFSCFTSHFTSLFSHQISKKLYRTETKEHTVPEAPTPQLFQLFFIPKKENF